MCRNLIQSQIDEEEEIEEHSKIENNNNNNNLNNLKPTTWFETTNINSSNKKKIIIKKKKIKNTNQYEDTNLNILDMIEKVQSNGFDDQRFSNNNNHNIKVNKNFMPSLNVSKINRKFIFL